MTDTATDQKATPVWYAAAEAEYRHTGGVTWADQVRRGADEINQVLADLGITPLTPARATSSMLLDAELLKADANQELWAVDATHDGKRVVLLVQDWRYQDSPILRGPALTSRAQVVHAHNYGAPVQPPVRDLRAEALRIADSLSGNLDATTYALADQIRALTLALLHTAGTGADRADRT
ncbi:hypothetical protein ACFV84_35125 [Kitasatospora sp. NPDC059811]|uniref:hypothetical protein n=1 Tax=Streptomycetaceae TaxID=2062 RepID=UPI0007AF915E|nr:hypothetical protein [Streptomyces sp. MJM8645]